MAAVSAGDGLERAPRVDGYDRPSSPLVGRCRLCTEELGAGDAFHFAVSRVRGGTLVAEDRYAFCARCMGLSNRVLGAHVVRP